MNVSVLETLAQHRKIPHICALFKNWRNGMESYWGLVTRTMPPQQGRSGLETKNRYWEIFLCTQDHKALEPAEVLATVSCKPHSSGESVRRVITRVCKWVMKCLKKRSEGK
jgi:hypothetical protein